MGTPPKTVPIDPAVVATLAASAGSPTLAPPPPQPAPTALTPQNPSVSGANATVLVTVPNTSGTVTFSLVVTDDLGVTSKPATVTVNIQGPPLAVLTTPQPKVTAGSPIQLSGANSTSTGTIRTFTFSLVPPT